MITFLQQNEVTFPAISIIAFNRYFGQSGRGAIQDALHPLRVEKIALNIDDYCNYDVDFLQDAFDCEFYVMPAHISSEDEFYRWVMETKFE